MIDWREFILAVSSVLIFGFLLLLSVNFFDYLLVEITSTLDKSNLNKRNTK